MENKRTAVDNGAQESSYWTLLAWESSCSCVPEWRATYPKLPLCVQENAKGKRVVFGTTQAFPVFYKEEGGGEVRECVRE